MRIAFLYTTFNRLYYTKQTLIPFLESVDGNPVLVVDNASTDGTRDYLEEVRKKYRFQVVYCDENRGITGAMNFFLNQYFGFEHLCKVDNDTLVPFGWWQSLRSALEEGKIHIIQAKHKFFIYGIKDWQDLEAKRPVKKISSGNLVFRSYVGGSGVLWRGDIVRSVPKVGLLYGWNLFQKTVPITRKALFSGAYVHLLDMASYNRYSPSVDVDYLKSIGRVDDLDSVAFRKVEKSI